MALTQWIDICDAAGLRTRNLDALTCHLIAGKIMHDPVVTQRKVKFIVGSVLAAGSVVRVLQEMTAAERAELRQRILP